MFELNCIKRGNEIIGERTTESALSSYGQPEWLLRVDPYDLQEGDVLELEKRKGKYEIIFVGEAKEGNVWLFVDNKKYTTLAIDIENGKVYNMYMQKVNGDIKKITCMPENLEELIERVIVI